VTGKLINNLVHIIRIKPYFYRDDFPKDPETLEENELEAVTENMDIVSVKQVVTIVPAQTGEHKIKKRK